MSWTQRANRTSPGFQRIRGVVVILMTLATLWVTSPDSHADGAWPLARGDEAATGHVDQTLPDELVEIWKYTAKDAIEATPVIVGDLVMAADVMGGLYAIRFSDGKLIWEKAYDTSFLASPALRLSGNGDQRKADLVVIGDVEGKVYALDPIDGREIWTVEIGGQIDGSANFFAGDVLVTSQNGSLLRLDGKSGEEVWRYETDDQVRCAPALAGNRTFLGGCDGQLHMVDLETGQSIGEPFPLGGPTGSTVAVQGNVAFLPTMEGSVFGFDWRTGKQIWHYADPDRAQEYRNSAAVNDKLVILSSSLGKNVDALDAKTGEPKWRYTLRRKAEASPVIAGEDVWIAATDGRLVRLSIRDGSEKWVQEYRGALIASPAIVGNQMIFADDEGNVRCLGPKR